MARVQQSHQTELIDALQHEVANRLHNVTQQVYMTDRHYKFGPQSLRCGAGAGRVGGVGWGVGLCVAASAAAAGRPAPGL